MRYAPSDRFWRNVLLTCVFTVFTLGFSLASYQGLKVSSPTRAPIDQATGRPASATPSGVAELSTAEPNVARRGQGRADELELLAPPPAFAGVAGDSRAADAAVSSRELSGDVRDLSRRGHSASSSRGGGGVGSGGGGFPGASFGRSSKKEPSAQTTLKTGSPSVSRKSNTKGNGKTAGSGRKGKAPEKATKAPREARDPGKLYAGKPSSAQSPASTPEPLSMILVGTGLAGLYRARKYLT
jgi:hypothetical protein